MPSTRDDKPGKIWILIADGHRARCFARDKPNADLTELADFVFPQQRHARTPAAGDVTGDAGKGHGRTAHSGTQFEPRTDARTVERQSFARELAATLDTAVAQGQCTNLSLILSAPMLGELRPLLSSATAAVVTATVTRDLTRYEGRDLRERVDAALQEAR